MAQTNPSTQPPTQHQYTVAVHRAAGGTATYTLLRDGQPVAGYVGLPGGWDDTTPWSNGTYTAAYHGSHGNHPSWSLDPAFSPARSGILLHTDYNSPSSKTSVGCVVAPPQLLDYLNAQIHQDNREIASYNSAVLSGEIQNGTPVQSESRNIKVSVTGEDQAANVTLSAITSGSDDGDGNSNSFVKLRLGLTKALSKDVWVFIKVNNPDDPNKTEFSANNLQKSVLVLDANKNVLSSPTAPVNLGQGSVQFGNVASHVVITGDQGNQDLNPSDKYQNGFWVRIPAGQTSEEVDVKPAYKRLQYDSDGQLIKGPDRTETFTVADYGIRYDGAASRTPSLYQDGLNAPNARASNLLTGGRATGNPVSVTISDQSLTATGNFKNFTDPRFKNAQSWTVGMDPDKDHTITAEAWGYPDNPASLRLWASVLDLHGQRHEISLEQNGSTYTVSAASLKGTEGQVTILAFQDDPHDFRLSVDGAGLGSPTPNNNLAPRDGELQANFTPGGTGTPNSTTSTYSNGVTTITTTDAAGNVIHREVDNADGTHEVEIYQLTDQPFTSTDRTYDVSGNVTSTTLYNADGTVYLSGTGVLNADGTTTVSLVDGAGAVRGFEIDQRYANYQPGATVVTLYAAEGQHFPTIEIDYDSYGGIQSRKYFDADGTPYQAQTTTDAAGTTTITFEDPSGDVAERDIINSDGSKQISIYYIMGSYASSVTSYASDGSIVAQTLYYGGGGTYQSTTRDIGTGTKTILTYDTSGNLMMKEVDNGARDVTTYGITGEPYSSMEVLYDFQGNVVSKSFYNTDGTSEIIQYPLPYDSGSVKTDTIYNANGQLTSQTIYNRDSSIASTETVVWNSDGSSSTQYRNGEGQLTRQELGGADGSRDVTTYAVPGQMRPSTENVYDASQNLVSTTVTSADGSKNVTIYGISGQIYGSVQTFYDPNGQAIGQSFFDQVGTLVETDTVGVNADGSTTTRYFDDQGVLTSQRVANVDGTIDVTAYGDAGIPYVKSTSHFKVSGDLVSETFYNRDGSIAQVETIVTNSDTSTTAEITDSSGNLTSRTITNADGSQEVLSYGLAPSAYVQSDIFYGADGNLRSATYYNSDGSIDKTQAVIANADGSTTSSLFDAAGTLLQREVTNADGSGTKNVFGVSGEAYSSVVTAFDTDGNTISETYFNNDGSQDVVTYATSGLYAQVDSYYDASGMLLTKKLFDESGALVLTGAVAREADGSTTIHYVNSTGTLTRLEADRADGTSSVTDYGVTGEPYVATETNYDVAGKVASVSFLNGNGSIYRTEAITMNPDGSTTVNLYDAAGGLLETDTEAVDGSRDVAVFGITGEAYVSTDSHYDVNGILISQVRNNADGTRDVLNYGLSDPNFTAATTHYDATGMLLSKTLLKADGSTYLVGLASTDSSGIVTIDYRGADNNVLRSEIQNPDGSSEIRLYQIAGQPYTSTDTLFDTAGNPSWETLYNSDQSIYRSAAFLVNDDGSEMETFFDSNFRFVEQDTLYANGSKDVFISDIVGQSYYATRSSYRADGSLSAEIFYNSDWSTRQVTYGITNKPYVATSTIYDYAGNVISITLLNADASVYETGTPVSSSGANGAVTIDYFDAAGALASVETSYSNGTLSVTDYSITGQPYASTVSIYDANGNRTAETLVNADGSTYASTRCIYDAGGNLLSEAFFNGDGSVNHVVGLSNGSTTTDYYAADGTLDHKSITSADGTSSLTQYGIAGELYSSTKRDYDAGGVLTQLTLFNSDGSREVNVYGISGMPYVTTKSRFDVTGELTSETFVGPGGDVYRQRTIVTASDGSVVTTDVDGSGNVVSQQIQGPDGSSVSHDYGIVGEPYTSAISAYDADGSLTSEIYYAADGSIYQTETVATDASGFTTTTVSNADGSPASQEVVAADGASVLTSYGINGQPYTSISASYDASGNLTTEIYYAADGSIYETDNITETVNPDGTTTVVYASSTGATKTFTYNPDGSPVLDKPIVTLTSAAEASNQAVQMITGAVVSGGAASVIGKIVTLTDNGVTIGTATVQSDGTFSASITLQSQGENSIAASVVDSYGNTGASAAVVDTLDDVAPTVTIATSPETSGAAARTIAGTVVSGGAAAVVGQTVTLTDNGSAIAMTTVQADGSFSASVTLPNQGTNSIVATVSDSFGNAGSSAPVVETLSGGPATLDFSSAQSSSAVFGLSGGAWTVTIGGQTEALDNVARVQFADKTFELVDQFGAGLGGYQSVQSAVDHASGGETILFAPGTYTESTVPSPYSSTAGGFFINKPNLMLQGVKADGSLITTAADAQSFGPTIITGAETDFGSNLFIGPDATGTILEGLHLAAGANTTNKLLEFWANDVTIENNFIDTFVNGTDTGAAAIYINVSGTPITQYLITGNILNDGIYVANGVGTAGQGISTSQVISNNVFEGNFDNVSGNGRYDMVAVQGRIPGIGWQPDPAQVPTIDGNTRTDNAAPFIFRMTEADPSLFLSAEQVATMLAQNTDATASYAYVLNSDGSLHLVDRDIGAGPFKTLYVASGIDTLNLGLTAPNALYGSYRDTINAGDTIVVQSVGHTVNDITVDNLTVQATASSSDLNLDLSSGVRSITLTDYTSGLGANVNVTGNNLGDTITGNSGNNNLTGGSGDDILVAGAGSDVLTGGGGYDVYKVGPVFGQTLINNTASDGTTNPQGEIDFGSGVADEDLWFARNGNDLQVDLLGTSNRLTIAGWYSDSRAQLGSFNTADGLKLDSQISQLVSSMATYASGNPGFDPATATQMPNDGVLQGAIGSAWHS